MVDLSDRLIHAAKPFDVDTHHAIIAERRGAA
jgi:hypothetical protein